MVFHKATPLSPMTLSHFSPRREGMENVLADAVRWSEWRLRAGHRRHRSGTYSSGLLHHFYSSVAWYQRSSRVRRLVLYWTWPTVWCIFSTIRCSGEKDAFSCHRRTSTCRGCTCVFDRRMYWSNGWSCWGETAVLALIWAPKMLMVRRCSGRGCWVFERVPCLWWLECSLSHRNSRMWRCYSFT